MNQASVPAPVAYVGFWARVVATIIDVIASALLLLPLRHLFLPGSPSSGSPMGFTLDWIVPGVIVLAFWFTRGATPGKMAVSATIVDALTLQPASRGQLVGRYFAYYLSFLSLGLGFLWVAFDARKQGWHDKIAGTVVIRRRAA